MNFIHAPIPAKVTPSAGRHSPLGPRGIGKLNNRASGFVTSVKIKRLHQPINTHLRQLVSEVPLRIASLCQAQSVRSFLAKFVRREVVWHLQEYPKDSLSFLDIVRC